MSRKLDVWVLPRLRARVVAPFLRALAPHFALARELDLRLRLDAEGNLVVLVPVPGAPSAQEPLRARLAMAFEAAGRIATELDNMTAQSRDISAEPPLLDGVLGWIWTQVIPASPDLDGERPQRRRAVILAGSDDDSASPSAPLFAALVRRSRDARFMTGGSRVTLLDLEDDPERGSTMAALRAQGLSSSVTLLARQFVRGVELWLPEGFGLADSVQTDVAELLLGLVQAGSFAAGDAVHLLPDGSGGGRAIHLPAPPPQVDVTLAGPADAPEADLTDPAVLAATIAPPDLPDELGPALRFSTLTLLPDVAAQSALNAHLNDRRFPMGYRISLARIPELSRSDEDIERLRAEIEEREGRIALILAMGRPQRRLLRFTDAQLPSLVDGLRKMPRALRDNAGLLYAATHAAGRPEPVHYILYDPELVQFEGVLPEAYWRAVIEDQPMAFWLDPHAEEARDGNPDEPMVFVPQGMQVLPYMDSFGGTLSGTLKLVLGNLFADGSAVLAAPGAQPAFVFSTFGPGGAAGGDEIGADLVDLQHFAPLKISLRWINEHILASSPLIADPQDRQELAETLYAGSLAKEIRAGMQAEVDALREGWAQAQDDLIGCFDLLVDAVTRQVAISRRRLEDAREFVDLSTARLAEVTQSLNGLGAALGGVDGELTDMAAEIPGLAAGRIAFFDRYQREYLAGEQALEQTRTEVTELRNRMESLFAELRRR